MSWQTYLYELQSCVLDLLVWISQVEVQKVKDLWFVNFTSADLIVLQLVPGVISTLVWCFGLFFLVIIFYSPDHQPFPPLTWYCKVGPTFQSWSPPSPPSLQSPSPLQPCSWLDWERGLPQLPPSLELVSPSCSHTLTLTGRHLQSWWGSWRWIYSNKYCSADGIYCYISISV